MRRIIERVVTVVTTTTWKISWETDPHPSQAAVDPVSEALPHVETLPESTLPGPKRIDAKEVDPPERENPSNLPAAGLPEDPNSYLLEKGNEKP